MTKPHTHEPFRILHLMASERWTGVAEPAVSLALLQADAGCETWVGAIWGRSLEERARARGARLAADLQIRPHHNPVAQLQAIRSLRSFIKRNAINIVHSHLIHDHWLAALAVRNLPASRSVALVRTVHRYETMRRDPLHHWLFEKQTGLIITVSTEQRDMILRAHPSLGDRIRVIFGGVNPERFRPDLPGAALVRADMGEKPDSAVAGIVAHLGYNRGHSWLLKAAPAVVEAVPNATLWIVGQGEIKYELREELRKPQYRRRVLMTGYRSADLPETYAAMDVGLLLGLGSEGSARAALEAMASGRPVIAVRKGSLCDTITDGKDGILVAENDVPSLQDALVRLLSNREEARRMGFAAREKILREFTENHRAAKTMAAYLDATRLRST